LQNWQSYSRKTNPFFLAFLGKVISSLLSATYRLL
jgi:hypothetical protein